MKKALIAVIFATSVIAGSAQAGQNSATSCRKISTLDSQRGSQGTFTRVEAPSAAEPATAQSRKN